MLFRLVVSVGTTVYLVCALTFVDLSEPCPFYRCKQQTTPVLARSAAGRCEDLFLRLHFDKKNKNLWEPCLPLVIFCR